MAKLQKRTVDYIEQHHHRIQEATRDRVLADKIVEAARIALYENPKLGACEPSTLLRAMVEAGRYGVIPGSLGHAYLIPRGKRACLEIGYRGWIYLASKSDIWPIEANAVCDGDRFECIQGTEKRLIHEPQLPQSGELVAVYAVAPIRKNKDTEKVFAVMSRGEVEEIRDRFSKTNQAWKDNFVEMAKKTVIRRLIKQLPVGSRLQEALAADGMEQPTDAELELPAETTIENATADRLDNVLAIEVEPVEEGGK